LLRCGRYSIGEFESIVNFCSLKGYRLNKKDKEEKESLIKSYMLLINKEYSDMIVSKNSFETNKLAHNSSYKVKFLTHNTVG
jgi:hypothetical protein